MSVSSDLLLDVYACPEQPDRWRHVLDHVCQQLGVGSAVVQMLRRDRTQPFEQWIARDTHSLAHAALHDALINNETNPRLDTRLAEPIAPGRVTRDRERFRPGCPHLAQLQARTAAVGLGEAIGVSFELPGNRDLVLLLHAELGTAREFGVAEEQFVLELAPHLRQAAGLVDTIREAHVRTSLLGDVMDRLSTGIVVVNGDRSVCWINDAAEHLLRPAAALRIRNGRLHFASARDEQRFADLLVRIGSEGADPGALAIDGDEEEALHIVVLPMPSPGERTRTGAQFMLLVTRAGHQPELSPSMLSTLFGLTPAEAWLTAALCRGDTVSDYADRRGIAIGTARIQLKQALAKTGAARQAELVRRVFASAAAQMAAQAST